MLLITMNDVKYHFDSFDTIIKLDGYNDITNIHLRYNIYYGELPEKLPKKLKSLCCHKNQITRLPDLPDTLQLLDCRNNELTSLPKLPDSLKRLHCDSNKLTTLGKKIPENMHILTCRSNNLIDLPLNVDNIMTQFDYRFNPVYDEIFYPNPLKLYLFKKRVKIRRANMIGEWFLDCKYNPKYKYCSKRLKNEYETLYDD